KLPAPANPANEVFSAGPAPAAASFCEPYRTLIEDELARGRDAMGIWQHLVDRHGFTGSYQCVKRFARKQHGPTSKVAHPVIETAPGEDYGESGVMVRVASPVARAPCWAACFATPSLP
ncbi:MAG: hypothetical protein IT368_06890, partial [Candidatus Hydrogenedentes bacterium]|nr:hypothetical protein [Candidatus Hydrogenedentota bacterium]